MWHNCKIKKGKKLTFEKSIEVRIEYFCYNAVTIKILIIGTPEIITIIVPQLEQMDFTVQYCVQKMQTE